MQCYTEIAPPTAVSHALHLPLLHARANNLVVAKNSLLQVFELKSTTTEVTPGGGDEAENAAANLDTEAADVPLQRTESTAKLVLVGEFPLAGTVVSLARVKALSTKSRGEALLVAFRDAKLSLVEWDPESYSLHTISIHYYENPDLPGIAPWSADLKDTYNFLTADPSSRCAALKFGSHNLAILPFRQRDLVDDDYDSDADGPKESKPEQQTASGSHTTPYTSSFVLPLTNLDPTLTHPVHLAFLHEYREPTFGIVAASRDTAPSLLAHRKDILTYSVFTLDLEQKASTTLLSVSGLPYDITRVVPLPSPIGGALLVGSNEIIHVDQGGKTNGVAVNEFAKACTSFPLSDQSDLALRLEGCSVELLSHEAGDVLVVLNNGRLLVLTFTLDGRTVSGMTVHPVAADHGGHLIKAAASCTSNLGRGRLFVGSEDGDSVMLGWTSTASHLRRKQSNANIDTDEDMSDEEDMEDMEDDLYNDTAPAVQKITAAASEPTAPGTYTFRIHDVLPSIAPIKNAVLHPGKDTESLNRGEVMLSTGRGAAASITALNRELHPVTVATRQLPSARGTWAVHARKQAPGDVTAAFGEDMEANMATNVDYDQYLVVSKTGEDGTESTVVYEVNGNELTETDKGDFEREEGSTLFVGVLAAGTKVVQVMRTEIRTYDSELNMDQILPMEDEESGNEVNVINASFADPYLLVLREDSSVKIFRATGDGELEDVEATGLSNSQWLSASLFKSASFTEVFAFLLTPEGGLRVFAVSDMEKPCYVAEALSFLPPVLGMDYVPKRSAIKATITEILAADLGDATTKSPHLIVRTSSDNLVIYKAFHSPSRSAADLWTKNLRWVKLSQQHIPRYTEDGGAEDSGFESTLLTLSDIGGYSTVFQRGTTPAFIFKESSSAPRVIGLSGKPVKSLTSFHTSSCQRGFAYLDSTDTLRISQLPPQTHYGHLGWATRRMPMDAEIHALAYHSSGLYIVGTGQPEEYQLDPSETYHYELPKEDMSFKPTIERGIIKLLDEKTWTIIDTHVLDPQEVVLSIKTLNLEVSENTHQRKDLVAVGTAILHGEDLATKGCIRIFEVITVVPEPDRPETNKRLKLIVKDEVKGAVSAISELGTQGFMIMAQGQKCMVRGLKEDGTLLPVAFMDMQCYVSDLKNLPGTGMLAMSDAYRGVWFTGYTEEPYRMSLFARSKHSLEAIAIDFIPFEEQLHLLVADADMNLQVLQFDPDNPKSEAGSRLLHKSTFHTGHFPATLHVVHSRLKMPSASDFAGTNNAESGDVEMDTSSPDDKATQPLHQILCTSQSGTLALVTPLSEDTYRRLSNLSAYLSNTLDATAGLNPRAFRASDTPDGGWDAGTGARGMLDGNLLMRWGELGERGRREGLAKYGEGEWMFWGEREVLAGWGVFGGRGK
ncbi:CPSF A subunit region-domain-containing protein [Bipolaris maydis]|uniref:CPSF A subunit region-domain-containing protein n=1 Tax=Cochliobolus heterostrophus TaxID=5016 RepID=UPI0024DC0B1D|nr:CPSF A subunit region-domain-containing protein [Bipolaris maydis]KAJ6197613.1 CPSF A subunit region-domain-containing protein [Bipolaris maydis]KAJ6271596.1 CPSF A subunit region-domain-containing protein [Bipolaris maydis]